MLYPPVGGFPVLFEQRNAAAAVYGLMILIVGACGVFFPGQLRRIVGRRWVRFLPALAVMAMVVLPHLDAFYESFERDLAVYMVTAQQMVDGHALYKEVWDHKPPGVHWTYALATGLLGSTSSVLAFLGMAASLAGLIGSFLVGHRLGGIRAAWFAALAWALASGEFSLQANQPNTESFIAPCLVWAFVLMLERRHSNPICNGVLTGGLFFLSSLYKTITAPVFVTMWGGLLLFSPRCLRPWKGFVASLATVAIGWGVVFAWFAWVGSFQEFWEAVFLYNRAYARGVLYSLSTALSPYTYPIMNIYLPLSLIVIAGIVGNSGSPRKGHAGVLLASFALGSWVAFWLPGQFLPHYFQLLIPPFILGAAYGVRPLLAKPGWCKPLLLALTLAPLVITRIQQNLIPIDGVPTAKYGLYGERLVTNRIVGLWLSLNVAAGETLFQWGASPELYFWSEIPPADGVLYHMPLIPSKREVSGNDLANTLTRRLIARLEVSRPDWVVAERYLMKGMKHPVNDWIQSHYHVVSGPEGIHHLIFYHLNQ